MTIPTEVDLLRQVISALSQRVDDMATAFAKMRAEVDASTQAVQDHHMWIMHGRGFRKTERAPEFKPKTPFEP